MWVCEFCNTKNKVDIVPEEVPLKEKVLYMITPGASAGSSGAMAGGQTGKGALVVFCIDTSGSMGTTTEVRFSFCSSYLKCPYVDRADFFAFLCRFLEYLN